MQSRMQIKETYWGYEESVHTSTKLALKRMYMRAGTQSSMELHVRKHEVYFLQSGTLKLGLREGRGINRSVMLKEGDTYEIPPGTPHMRMAVTDCVILEACSYDDLQDTVILFDGKTYKFEEDDGKPISG